MRYLLGEGLVAEDAVDTVGMPFMQFRAPTLEEWMFVGHVAFDNQVKGERVLGLNLLPRCMGHVSLDREAVGFQLSAISLQLWKRED